MLEKIPFKLKIFFMMILSYVILNIIFYKFFNYIFIDVLNECLIDEYGVDCFGPVTKSSFISEILSIFISIIIGIIFYKKKGNNSNL